MTHAPVIRRPLPESYREFLFAAYQSNKTNPPEHLWPKTGKRELNRKDQE